jgi:hypothetical protein
MQRFHLAPERGRFWRIRGFPLRFCVQTVKLKQEVEHKRSIGSNVR